MVDPYRFLFVALVMIMGGIYLKKMKKSEKSACFIAKFFVA